MSFKKYKYKYVDHQPKDSDVREIIAISSFHGETVKGYAKCHPDDTFNAEYGETLASLRCNLKICEKRFNNTGSYLFELENEKTILEEKIKKAKEDFYKTEEEYQEAIKLLEDFLQ